MSSPALRLTLFSTSRFPSVSGSGTSRTRVKFTSGCVCAMCAARSLGWKASFLSRKTKGAIFWIPNQKSATADYGTGQERANQINNTISKHKRRNRRVLQARRQLLSQRLRFRRHRHRDRVRVQKTKPDQDRDEDAEHQEHQLGHVICMSARNSIFHL